MGKIRARQSRWCGKLHLTHEQTQGKRRLEPPMRRLLALGLGL